MAKKKVRAGVIQMESVNGQIDLNLDVAEKLLREASTQNATLILFPEFFAQGYCYTDELWDVAESIDGKIVQLMQTLSKELKIYIGFTFLEAEHKDFFNTFLLIDPDGAILGKIRKQTPAAFESFFTVGEESDHYIDTPLGRIGVGICYENQLSFTIKLFIKHSVDFVLMPHSAPRPMPVKPFSLEKDSVRFVEVLKNVAVNYAKILGVPVLLANKCGKWETDLPWLFKFFGAQKSFFPGLSTIVDLDGMIKGQMGKDEINNFLVQNITLDSQIKSSPTVPVFYKGKALKTTWNDSLWGLYSWFGKRYYKKSAKRILKALRISGKKQ